MTEIINMDYEKKYNEARFQDKPMFNPHLPDTRIRPGASPALYSSANNPGEGGSFPGFQWQKKGKSFVFCQKKKKRNTKTILL